MDEHQILIETCERQILTAAGTLNSAVLRRPAFVEGDLYKQILRATSFLPQHSPIAQRWHAIKNRLTEHPKCVCGKPVRWCGYKHKPYLKCCSNMQCSRSVVQWKSNSAAKRDSHANLLKRLHQVQYVTPSDAEVLDWISKFESLTGQFYLSVDLFETRDIIVIKFLIDNHYIDWSRLNTISCARLIYDYKNQITQQPKCPRCDRELTFRNSKIGYSSCNTKTCLQTLVCMSRVVNHNNFVRQQLSDRGLQLLTTHGLNNGHHTILCSNCNKQFDDYIAGGFWQYIQCPHCFPSNSRLQQSITQYVTSLLTTDTQILTDCQIPGNANKQQLDIYLPQHKLAIECNGVYWHSDRHSRIDRNFHATKTDLCNKQSIALLQIWETEWNDKTQLVKSMIAAKLGIFSHVLDARKCRVVILDKGVKSRFLNDNHIQGNDGCKVAYGLMYNDELVSVMTFGSRRITGNQPQWELMRFCNLQGYTIRGGASRLLAAFVRQFTPQQITTYADRRYSNGNLYHKLGFIHQHDSSPGYCYLINGALKHRSGYMKHKLQKRLLAFDANLTEVQNMNNNGYFRVWDCGHGVFLWKNESFSSGKTINN